MARTARLLTVWLLCAAPLAAFAQGEPPAVAPAPAAAPAAGAAEPPKIVLTDEAKAQLSAADQARADELAAEGNTLYGNGLYEQAIDRFRTAHGINGDINLLYSIAISYQQLRKWDECVEVMDRYLVKAPLSPKKDRAQNTRDSCDARIERDQVLTVESDPPGSRVYIDNRNTGAKGQTPFKITLRPGSHRVWIEQDGFEPMTQDIELQKKEPFTLKVTLVERKDQGYLFVDSTVTQARVYIDGQNIGLTPFTNPHRYGAGPHQVIVERDGYTRIATQVQIERGQLARVDAYMVRTESFTTWRTTVGVVAEVLGAAAIAGGIVAWQFADDEYNDTDEFETLSFYERLGYGVGGGLMAIGTSLIIWDLSRDVILEEHRNPDYGRPVQSPVSAPAPTARVSVGPGGLVIGGTF